MLFSLFTEKMPGIRLLTAGLPGLADLLLPEDLDTLGVTAQFPPAKDSADERPVYLCGSATSSMDVARVLANYEDLPVWGSVLASCQRAGKGQMGRHWISPMGNIYAALRLPNCLPFTSSAASPAMGGLLAQAIVDAGMPVRMKWPNDMVNFLAPPQPFAISSGEMNPTGSREWRKVGGILIEERQEVIIAGIGLNLVSAPPVAALRREHVMPAGTLMQAVHAPGVKKTLHNPLLLWMQLANSLFFHYKAWTSAESWLKLAERHLAFRGRPVLFMEDERENADDSGMKVARYQGILEGLDRSGGLRIRLSSRNTQIFCSGSLLLPWMDDALQQS